MKFLFSIVLLPLVLWSQTIVTSLPDSRLSPSLLNETVQVSGFGDVRIRRPLSGNAGFPVLLIHGVYGGASHRTFKE